MSIFSQVETSKVKSNTFDLTHDVKLSTQFGKLTPICIQETMPGDRFDIQGSALVRLAPMVAPVMHRASVYLHYFFVPNRILWPKWKDFITGGREGTDTSVHPHLLLDYSQSYMAEGQLPYYLGCPPNTDVNPSDNPKVNAFPFAAYNKIYNDYYRDQNFTPEIPEELKDGQNVAADFTSIKTRAWQHDYFTSALPWTQRGPEAMLPLGNEAAIVPQTPGNVMQFFKASDGTNINGFDTLNLDVNNGQLQHGVLPNPTNSGTDLGYVAVEDSHKVDLTSATAASINDLRRAVRLQEWLEKNARGGGRYNEVIKMHFATRVSDSRLQRAEFIGGSSSPIKFSEVLQTSGSDTSQTPTVPTPQGNMAGHGISVGGASKKSYFCEEHGWIIGILSVLPTTAYQQGLHRSLLRFDKFDYPWPSFAHIGEQGIQRQELYVETGNSNRVLTWGYTPRYSEMKFANNRVAGQFRTSLDTWHIGRKWTGLQPLNQQFIECRNVETDRIFAVTDPNLDKLWIQVLNQIKVSRRLPVFGTPYL